MRSLFRIDPDFWGGAHPLLVYWGLGWGWVKVRVRYNGGVGGYVPRVS